MSPEVPEVVDRYFSLDAERDTDAIVALFTGDAPSSTKRGAAWQGRDPRLAHGHGSEVHLHGPRSSAPRRSERTATG